MSNFRIYLPNELDEFLQKVGDGDKNAAAGAKRGTKEPKARSRKRKG